MKLVSLFLPLCGRREIDVEPAIVHFAGIARDLILFVSRFSLTCLVMELPVMPGTDHVLAVEGAFA